MMSGGWPIFPLYLALWRDGLTREAAVTSVKVIALRVIADEIEHGERSPDAADTSFAVAA